MAAAAATAATESSLLAKLESSTSTPIFAPFSDYLLPFANLKKKASKPQDKTLPRSLAKQFLPFLNRSILILRKRLKDPSQLRPPNDETPKIAVELFDIYRLCLDCVDLISSELSCKPYELCEPRLKLLCFLEAWGFYREGQRLGLEVLERLKGLNLGVVKGKARLKFLPAVVENGNDELVRLVVELVRSIVKCVARGHSVNGEDYWMVLRLLEEGNLWFRVLDATAYEKFQRALVSEMSNCMLFLLEKHFEGELLCAFCITTLNFYANSSKKDKIYEFARLVCFRLFSLHLGTPSVIINVLKCVLDFISRECKDEVKILGKEFVELVSYCANKCRTAGTVFCSAFADHLNVLAGDMCQVMTPLDLILRLYATALSGVKDDSVENIIHDGIGLCNLAPLLGAVKTYFYSGCNKENAVTCDIEYKDLVSQFCTELECDCGNLLTCTQKKKRFYLMAYIDVLNFLCGPLAELVNSEKKQIVVENNTDFVLTTLVIVQDAFNQFCDVFLSYHSKSKNVNHGFDENKVIPSVAVAAFTLSIRTKLNLQKSVSSIKRTIASQWIQPRALKYLFTSLYNVGVSLYRSGKVDEASNALNLCCRASWICVKLLCQMFMQKANGFSGDLSEEAIIHFVSEACAVTASILDVLHQCGSPKVEKIIAKSLAKWAIAEDLFKKLPGPMLVVKKWVKIQIKVAKNTANDGAPTLYSLLSSSVKASKMTIGKILQQELNAYEDMESLCPELCQRMQMKIVNDLLGEVYVTPDSFLQKSRVLLRKGRAFRALGFEGLKDCIQCLSEAIILMNDKISSHGTSLYHQLAAAYCLRALCTHEAEPSSKQVYQDIRAALSLWLSIQCEGYDLAYDECRILPDGVLLLLYNIVDLLSMKGFMEFQDDIYKLMIRLFELKNVPLEKWLPILWESRRLSHALCVSPINDTCMMNLVGASGEQLNSVDFWLCCLRGSPHSLVGFQQIFSYLLASSTDGSPDQHTSSQSDLTVDDVREAAIGLMSRVPGSSSAFFVGYLYYDLCERLVASGHLFEALSFAQEALQLRTKLFQEKFTYSVEQHAGKCTEIGDQIQKINHPHNLQVNKLIATHVWSFDTISLDLEACHLSAWKVLQCYIESTLQVGIVHEMIGNGVEAEALFLWGKGISCSQNLSLFTVAFSCVLGQLYRKKQSWDLSEKELLCAKEILAQYPMAFCCSRCRLVLEVTVDQQFGDLNRSCMSSVGESVSLERLSLAENIYKSALNKLNLPEWNNCVSYPDSPKKVEDVTCSTSAHISEQDFALIMAGSETKMEGRKCRKTKNMPTSVAKEQYSTTELNKRVTRSRYRSSHNQSSHTEIQSHSKHLKDKNFGGLADSICLKEPGLEMTSCTVDLGCKSMCISNDMKCWFCIVKEVMKSGLLSSLVHMKWELVRRKLSLRALTSLGKCLELPGQLHQRHEVILQSISILVNRNPFIHTVAPTQLTFFLDLIGKEFSEDVFSIERAAFLYNMCWFFLRTYHSKDTRTVCCDLPCIQLPKIVSLLMVAFVLCREFPVLFKKVSRLLSAIYLLSSSSELFYLPPSCNSLSGSHWASFFHQASIGTHLNSQYFSNMTWKRKSQHLMDDQVVHEIRSVSIGPEKCNTSRLAPNSIQNFEQFVTDFFVNLPCTTIICISLIGGSYTTLLQELLGHSSCVSAWMLLSRFNYRSQPIVMLLPVGLVSEEALDNEDLHPGSGELLNNDLGKHWHCPWGFTVVDEVVPAFKHILEENYLSSSIFSFEDNKKNRDLWWKRRRNIDFRLGQLLRGLEDSWLGPWRYVLLGQKSNKNLDGVLKKLVRDLKSKCKFHVNESFLKVVLGGAGCTLDGEVCCLQLLSLKDGCFIGKAGNSDEESCEMLVHGHEKASDLAIQLLDGTLNELKEEDSVREPVILVLDYEVQMLPWENLPTLRNQEVYRMPSVGSIYLTLERNQNCQEQDGKVAVSTPVIDPLDAFYLLNPSGDLIETQVEFETWFRDQSLEGKAGSAPAAEELALALKSHDLFIYFGHGSGAQYISQHEVKKLKNCAATFLMGCSSGSLLLNGCYIPDGTPLSYLLAGSPIIVANLWEVTDKDIDRFGKALLDAWLKERYGTSNGCIKCSSLAEEFEAMSIRGGKGNAKKKVTRKKNTRDRDSSSLKDCCDHKPKVGSFIGQARQACALPYLIGASPVCYGVPTGIRRKDL